MRKLPVMQERLRRETGQANQRFADLEARLAAQRRPPQPGDLFLLPETAELPVEWAILEQDPDSPRRLLAVPADANSLVGSADVASPAASRGPLSLRCRFGVWLDRDALAPEMRTGSLAPEALAQARHKRRELREGGPVGSAPEREVDADPEYQDWVEDVLEKARAAFPEKKPGKVVAFPRASRWHPIGNPYAIAASILVLVSLGLGRELLRARQEREGHRQELAEPLLNMPFFVLAATGLRGEEKTLAVPSEASLLMLIFQLDDPEPFPRYRLEIRQAADGREIWSSGDLRTTGRSELSVALPASLLPAGRYRLGLSGLGEREEEVARFLLRIEVE